MGLVHTPSCIGEGRGRRLARVPPLCAGCQNQLQQDRMRPTDAKDTRTQHLLLMYHNISAMHELFNSQLDERTDGKDFERQKSSDFLRSYF